MSLHTTPTPREPNSKPQKAAQASPDNSVAIFQGAVARAKRVGIFTQKMTLTPGLAEYIIGHHMPPGSNRRLKVIKVAMLADVIRSGGWDSNTHQGLAISVDGVVNDGQHRINATAQAGVPIDVLITFGQPRSTFEVIDQDITPRSAADLLDIAGLDVGTPATAAAIARSIVAIDIASGGVPFADAIRQTSRQDVLDFTRANAAALKVGGNAARLIANGIRAKVSPSNIGAALFLIGRTQEAPDLMEQFADALRSGAALAENSPILVCREGLRAGAFGAHIRTGTDRRIHEIAAVVKAWNAWRRGRTASGAKVLRIKDFSEFPQVIV